MIYELSPSSLSWTTMTAMTEMGDIRVSQGRGTCGAKYVSNFWKYYYFFVKTRRAVLKIRLFFEWLKTKINFVPMRGWESYDKEGLCQIELI